MPITIQPEPAWLPEARIRMVQIEHHANNIGDQLRGLIREQESLAASLRSQRERKAQLERSYMIGSASERKAQEIALAAEKANCDQSISSFEAAIVKVQERIAAFKPLADAPVRLREGCKRALGAVQGQTTLASSGQFGGLSAANVRGV